MRRSENSYCAGVASHRLDLVVEGKIHDCLKPAVKQMGGVSLSY